MNQFKFSSLRTYTILFFVALVVFGLLFHSGTGTLSAFGYKTITAICPLGSVETFLASKTFVPAVFISLAVFLVISIIFGRIFCAWVCPVPLFRKWFPKKTSVATPVLPGEKIVETNTVAAQEIQTVSQTKKTIDTSYYVLGGALGSTFLFGFPVFCLICPIGLTFAVIVSFWRLIQFNEPTWSLAIFPALLILELALFRYSCRKFCPLGALISLMSRANVFFKPKIDQQSCLQTTKGADCKICQTVCHEDINLHRPLTPSIVSRCTKCMDCSDACPMHAISFSFFKKKSKDA